MSGFVPINCVVELELVTTALSSLRLDFGENKSTPKSLHMLLNLLKEYRLLSSSIS